MIVRSLDLNGDWNFGKGQNDYLSANKAIAQNVATRLRSFLGDCFFDIKAGVDWFNLLGSKNRVGLELAVRSVILNTELVTGISSFSLVLDSNRKVSMTYSINTVYTDLNKALVEPVVTFLILAEDGDALSTGNGRALFGG